MAKNKKLYEIDNHSSMQTAGEFKDSPAAREARELANSPAMQAKIQNQDMNGNQVEFSIFCIENVAIKLGISGGKAYHLLTNDNDILDEYIIPNYEMLHTQDKEYIVNDIIDYMKECGVLQ